MLLMDESFGYSVRKATSRILLALASMMLFGSHASEAMEDIDSSCHIFGNPTTCTVDSIEKNSSHVFNLYDKSGNSYSIECLKPASGADRWKAGRFLGQDITCYYSISTMGHRSILVYDSSGDWSYILISFDYAHKYGR